MKKTGPLPATTKSVSKAVPSKELRHIPLELIKCAPYNPDGRDNAKNRHVKTLARDIHGVGQLQAATVVPDGKGGYLLVDGHRRLAALWLLRNDPRTERNEKGETGYETLMAVVHHDCKNTLKAYESLNTQVKKHSSNETLKTWILDKRAVEGWRATAYQNMEDHITPAAVKSLAARGMTICTYLQAYKVAEHCGYDPEKNGRFVARALDWIITAKQTRAVRAALENKREPKDFITAIDTGVPLAMVAR